ncbi:beta-glucosidase [Streptomyces sp. NPDC056987]|uniref:beta-xylosidase/alpha-l-arabinosidase n=1 Tax=Streptomyces sp. NPDC056987 TaxID=3345988 RepID=UPI00362834B8
MIDNVSTETTAVPGSALLSEARARRVEELIAAMTTEEKLAQLYGLWAGASADGAEVAPHQHDMDAPPALAELLPYGLGQLTRPFGTVPVDPALGALSLMRTQERVVAASRFGVPAMAHDECLAGFAAWGATTYPVPLSWGASFDPELVREMAGAIGRDMRSVGLHQGLAPVLDVVRDARWGRVEETIGEDPYLVGTVATAYVRGLESAGIVATLKHFAGYAASRGGRNLAPVGIGPRELADVVLPPFEMAVREGGVRSVMAAYNDLDGVPCAADERLLTGLLRDVWGFDGTVVSDYFGVAFLATLHGVAGDRAQAATAALAAGVDVELPTVNTFGRPLRDAVAGGRLPGEVVDRAVRRVLTQKAGLGLLDPGWSARPAALAGLELDGTGPERLRGTVTLDSPAHRDISRRLAERSVILLRNDGTLPLAAGDTGPARIALIGPQAETRTAVLGCYSFPVHVGARHPDTPIGIELPTLREALAAEFPASEIVTVAATGIDDPVVPGAALPDGFAEAVRAVRAADVAVLALGDRAGLFGRGTSGEGCDAETLDLPGAQGLLLNTVLDAARAAGTRVVVTLLAGRPYVLGRAVTEAGAIVQAFFPGQEGTPAVAGVLSGRINPSGRLPVSAPRLAGAQPSTYLAAPLARASDVSSIDPTPAFGFGHGLTYTSFTWSELEVRAEGAALPTDGAAQLAFTVTNTGGRAGVEVVQLYLHDPVASVVQPAQRLIGYVRLPLAAGERARIGVTVPADLASFTGRDGRRIVEPGALELRLAASSTDVRLTAALTLTGPVRYVDHTRALHATFTVGT